MFRTLVSGQCVLLASAALTVAAVAGCSSSQSASAGSQATPASSTGAASAKTKIETQIDDCFHQVGLLHLLSASGRANFTDCVKAIAPPAKQEQFKNCLSKAATSDQLWTKKGREQFESADAPACLNAAA